MPWVLELKKEGDQLWARIDPGLDATSPISLFTPQELDTFRAAARRQALEEAVIEAKKTAEEITEIWCFGDNPSPENVGEQIAARIRALAERK